MAKKAPQREPLWLHVQDKITSDGSTHLKGIVQDLIHHFQQSQLLLISSSLAYTTILSIIPLLAVSFALFQSFGGMDQLYGVLEPFVLEHLAQGSGEQTMTAIKGFISKIHAGTLGVGGLIGLIFTCISMLSSAEKAINKIWNTPIQRSLFHRISAYWLFITLGPLGMSILLGATSSSELSNAKLIPAGSLGALISIAIFFAIYKWVPNRQVHWLGALISGIWTTLSLGVAKHLYGLYTAKVVTYSKIYGSLGAIPIFLLWVYILWVIILSGAVITASLQRRLELR